MKLFTPLYLGLFLISCWGEKHQNFDLISIEKERVLALASHFKNVKPVTLTSFICERSAGNKHDFYSEGDYWWPDPENPNGPYIRKDGLSNPNNFTAHRESMIQLSQISGTLASAYIITNNEDYVEQLMPHLKAWFINNDTKMYPSLKYAQAIKGVVTGRGIGIIDTVHLMEVALAVKAIEKSKSVSKQDILKIKDWFKEYLNWLITDDFGKTERDNGNNHSVCWAMQVAVFAKLVGNQELLNVTKEFYKNTLLPNQMDFNGSFPLELARTKPYGYSIFNLDAMATLCQILSTNSENLFEFKTKEDKSLALGLKFLVPYIKNKKDWPYKKDIMYWDEWPVRQPSLLFGGLALNNEEYLNTWMSLKYELTNKEIIRNMPVKYPILWFNN
ncbi:alginate lyase family protein [Siansivirga zeaxanthinifaciens]|uniref:Alginate lyase n=1 Tax=Siansivirga zeaxanthinifaciens CC-SAMT-1 TaxID=1454006 RepID=A0A0C5WDW8_9FLAO|nr:alginate lyase family protein [Siansivirga zeaxanthinifaciens]AJR04462.1 alginate lyase [Siansivirga zeaxanthinifaciens CC-SAMT-1]